MAFDPSVPNAAQNPKMFPQQGNIDFKRLKTIIGGDHVFNDAVTATDGIHKQVTLTNVETVPATVLKDTAVVYSRLEGVDKPTQLYFFNGTTEQQVTPDIVTFPKLFAYVNFNGYPVTGGGNQVIKSSSNIKNVQRLGKGHYGIYFTTPCPTNNYIVQITGSDPQVDSSNNASLPYGYVYSSTNYNGPVNKSAVFIQFRDNLEKDRDVLMANVAIIRVS